MPEIRTVGDLKRFLVENEVTDDTEVWIGQTVEQGQVDYFDRCKKYWADIEMHEETFGLALPPARQTRKTGVVIW